jgi:hypothetical protein
MPATIFINDQGATLEIEVTGARVTCFWGFSGPLTYPWTKGFQGFRDKDAHINSDDFYLYTFNDNELDTTAMLNWWNNHGPGVRREDQDFFKNDKWGRESITSYSVIARLLKQGGAQELRNVDSPSVGKNWRKEDLITYARNIGTRGQLDVPWGSAGQAQVSNPNMAQK